MTPERIKIVLDCLRELSREHARNWNPHRSALMRIELKEGIEQRIIAYLGV